MAFDTGRRRGDPALIAASTRLRRSHDARLAETGMQRSVRLGVLPESQWPDRAAWEAKPGR